MDMDTKTTVIQEARRRLKMNSDARLEVRLVHPNGHVLEQTVAMPIDVFGAISWRDIEENQMMGLVMAGREPDKEELLRLTRHNREKVISDAVGRIAFELAKQMTDREADAYDPWNS